MARQTSDLTLVSMMQQMRLHRLFKPVGSSFIVGLLLLPVLLPAQSAQAQSNDEVVFQTLDPLETLSTSQPVNNDAVARRLTRIEQLLRSQSAMQNAGNSRDTDGSQPSRDTLQAILDRLDRIEASLTGGFTAAGSGNNTSSILAGDDQTAADLRVRLSSLEETLRNISGQSEQVLQLIQSNELARQKDREDSEYRFQALEGKMRQQANKGSSEPQIIGTIPGTAPIENSVATGNNTTANLVGEGDLSILNGSQADGRGELNDPLALYERAMAALKQGEYGNARLDFKQLIAKYPKHIRAGNAQYWLGESHYVQGNYKKAAEAFLVGYTEYAANSKGPDSLLKLGMTLIAMGEIKTGCDAFSELKANFPDAPDAVTKRAEIEKKRAGCK
ncbi:tol-pal system protein YbgF [Alphaproteobacteria bacterium]|nr:tol-pal system protein YbgF [Alphaproteobacteria bacterium]